MDSRQQPGITTLRIKGFITRQIIIVIQPVILLLMAVSFVQFPVKEFTSGFCNSTANKVITKFNDYLFHEIDSVNLMMSGKTWYGEYFDFQSSYSFPFSFPILIRSPPVSIKTDIAGRYTSLDQYIIICR